MAEKRVLMIVTSHDKMGDTDHPTGFWLEEAIAPYYVFKDSGLDITVASPKGGTSPIDPRSEGEDFQNDVTRRYYEDEETISVFKNTAKLADMSAEQFDGVFVPGGHGPMWDFPGNGELKQLLEDFASQDKPIAAVCHGPVCLVDLKDSQGDALVKGKKLTCFSDEEEIAVELQDVVPFMLETRLKELGASYDRKDKFTPHTVTDGLLITGQNPPSSEPTAKALLEVI